MHDIYAIHIRQNSVHVHLKLLVVIWLGLSVTVRVWARNRKSVLDSFFFLHLKKRQILLSHPFGLTPVLTSVDTAMSQYDVSVT